MRYNQDSETTALSPVYGWLMIVLCVPATVWVVTYLIQATEWWQYASVAIFIFGIGTVLTYGIKTLIQSRN